MTELKTDAALLARLKRAASRPLSPMELYRQRVSYVMGAVKESSGITREQVEQQLAKQGQGAPAK